ncbi:MAG: hypothetical protein HF967_07710 [Methanosarcinales archaeon]|nr:hypothetical protein [Methanosarcinales archaeon]
MMNQYGLSFISDADLFEHVKKGKRGKKDTHKYYVKKGKRGKKDTHKYS